MNYRGAIIATSRSDGPGNANESTRLVFAISLLCWRRSSRGNDRIYVCTYPPPSSTTIASRVHSFVVSIDRNISRGSCEISERSHQSQRIETDRREREREREKGKEKTRNGAPKAYASFWRSLYSRVPPFYRLRMLKGWKRRKAKHDVDV